MDSGVHVEGVQDSVPNAGMAFLDQSVFLLWFHRRIAAQLQPWVSGCSLEYKYLSCGVHGPAQHEFAVPKFTEKASQVDILPVP